MKQTKRALNRRRSAGAALAAAAIAATCIDAAAHGQDPPCYEVTATFTGPDCSGGATAVPAPYAVNDDGWIAGFYMCQLGWRQAFLWSGQGQAGPLPMPPGVYLSHAHDVNSQGWTVGYEEGQSHWAFFNDGVTTMLIPPPNNRLSEAMAINDDGWIVGFWWDGGYSTPFKWRNGEFTSLGPALGVQSSVAEDINNVDPPQITGWRGVEGPGGYSVRMAYILQGEEFIDLGPITGGFDSWAHAINDLGEVVGKGRIGDPAGSWVTHAFHWSDGVMTDLGTLPGYQLSIAYDINDRSEIVGFCDESANPRSAATLWRDGQLWDLNDLVPPGTGLHIEFARGINDAGQIAASAFDSEGYLCGVLLTPIRADLTGDCTVDHDDLLVLLSAWSSANSPADFNNDGTVDVLDLLFLLAEWTD